MSSSPSSFADPAIPVLQNAQGITDSDRADLHDIFHNSKDADELAQKLQPLAVPDDVKSSLYDTKKKFQPAGALPKATQALSVLAGLDPKVLDLAESHPKVTAALIAAATKDAEAAAESAKAEGKGKQAKDGSEAPTMKPDVPVTPPGHALVLASDGGLHHVPVENVDRARRIDPELQVLHVQE